MKLGIVLLLLLGVGAALCAAVLVGAVNMDFFGSGKGKAPQTFTVMVAARDLPAMKIITSDCIEKKEVLISDVRAAFVSETDKLAVEAGSVGRVLRVAMVKDQILLQSSFVPQGSAEELLAKLPDGMRAFTVNLRSGYPDRALLRPGGIVDIVSITTSSRERGSKAVASPLLSGILVLAVQSELVIDTPAEGKAKVPRNRSSGVQVTLQVDHTQASALQLAITQGSIALFCRNPNDKKETPSDSIMLEEGRLVTVTGADLKTAEKSEEGKQDGVVSKLGGNPNETGNAVTAVVPSARKPRRRTITINLGTKTTKTEKEEFQESTTGGDSSKATPFGHERRFNEVGRTVNEIAR